jgi:hypothetical protein
MAGQIRKQLEDVLYYADNINEAFGNIGSEYSRATTRPIITDQMSEYQRQLVALRDASDAAAKAIDKETASILEKKYNDLGSYIGSLVSGMTDEKIREAGEAEKNAITNPFEQAIAKVKKDRDIFLRRMQQETLDIEVGVRAPSRDAEKEMTNRMIEMNKELSNAQTETERQAIRDRMRNYELEAGTDVSFTKQLEKLTKDYEKVKTDIIRQMADNAKDSEVVQALDERLSAVRVKYQSEIERVKNMRLLAEQEVHNQIMEYIRQQREARINAINDVNQANIQAAGSFGSQSPSLFLDQISAQLLEITSRLGRP